MKKILVTSLTILILALSVTSCSPIISGDNATMRTMNVNGTGMVKLEPDIARVNIGVRTQSADIAEAFAENNTNAKAVIESLIALGVDQSDIQTRNFNIYQQQQEQPRPILEGNEDNEANQEPIITYVVENTVAVTVRELDSLGEMLTKAIDGGANTIYGVAFDIEDRESALAEAQTLAIKDAQEQAQAIADAADIKLGPIHTISINQEGIMPREQPAAMMGMGYGGSSVPIEAGSMTIRVTAQLTFEIE